MRPIPGFDGYFVSENGVVSGPRIRDIRGRVDRDGYRRVGLYSHGRTVVKGVHWLVCLAFHGEPPPGNIPRHLDGMKQNNVPSNLRWGTHLENWADRRLHGTDVDGERNGRARLTRNDVEQIRKSLMAGDTQQSLANRYGVKQAAISKIHLRKLWR